METNLNPIVRHVFDFKSDAVNELLTLGGKALISGEMMDFDVADPQQGIFLKSLMNLEETRLSGVMIKEQGKKMLVMVPDYLSPGNYELIVRNIRNYAEGKLRRKLKVQ